MPDLDGKMTGKVKSQETSASSGTEEVRRGVRWVGAFFVLLGSLFLAIASWGIISWPNAGGLFCLGMGWTMMTTALAMWWDMRAVTPHGSVWSAGVRANWIPRRSTHRVVTGSAVLLGAVLLTFATEPRFRDPTLLFALCVPAFLLAFARSLRHAAEAA